MNIAQDSINLKDTRQIINKYIDNGTLDKRIIDTLVVKDKFIPKECELWDYKQTSNKDAISLAQTILKIVSFYNSYGGYLIYGVKEAVRDKEFVPIGIVDNTIDIQQLKQCLNNYTCDAIDISYAEIKYDIENNSFIFGILHIPKRPYFKAPVFFGKNGPQKEDKQLVFKKDTSYIRFQDKCIVATTKEDFQLLFSDRINPFLWDSNYSSNNLTSSKILVNHNLPDRNFICPNFIGRENEIQELWKWLADELSNAKVLAGEGGKGKTSIAYEFAEEICRTKPYGIEKVIWLTAKSKQFVGIRDDFINVPLTNYYDLESLLKAICLELAIFEQEIEDASIAMLKRLIKKAIDEIPCLLIIDDIDSTELDQQKKIFEAAMQFPGSRARFLLTSRQNLLFSSAGCIHVSGLVKSDYDLYLDNALSKYKCDELNSKQRDRIFKATEGSPLFTDSLCRLFRMGMSIDLAIHEWEGKLGSEVRKAALNREIESLSVEARRVLLACSHMGEASLSELKQVTGYGEERMQNCINELTALFLLSAQPIIKSEVRFRVSTNTARLVTENATMLVADPSVLTENVTKLRKGRIDPINKRTQLHPIGAAITQAVALLKENRYDDAIETIESTLSVYKDNKDLLFARSRCLLEKFKANHDSKSLVMARRSFKKSFDFGQRKELMFELWYESEKLANDNNGVIEVTNIALENEIPLKSEWLKRRAMANINSSIALERSMNIDSAIEKLKSSASDIYNSILLSKYYQKEPLSMLLSQVTDRLWNLSIKSIMGDLTEYKELFDIIKFGINCGDIRFITFTRLLSTIEKELDILDKSNKITSGQKTLVRNMLIESKVLFNGVHDTMDPENFATIKANIHKLENNVYIK